MAEAGHFPSHGSHLERYAQTFDAVEINTSFYRPHQRSTYERWAGAVPESFQFAVKIPKAITHERRLVGAADLLARFLSEVGGLGTRLGPLLLQLPPSLAFADEVAGSFLEDLRERFPGDLVCEPRHASWFTPKVNILMERLRIGRVAADPHPITGSSEPGGWLDLVYYRLHGSPRMYYSPYAEESLKEWARGIKAHAAGGARVWCIFDNTAAFAATGDALTMTSLAEDR
jgi:uncharacterized protein YecE (DUF72 family)